MPTTPFLNMFGRSPIRPLEAHMSKVHVCVKELAPFFEAVLLQKWSDVERVQQEIVRLENEADDLKRDLRLHLPKGLFLPVSRSDLLELLTVQDRLANKAKDIAGVVLGRRMVLPEVVAQNFMDFLSRCIEASKQANIAINELDELLETGFSGSEVKLVESMIAEISRIERDTDDKQIKLRLIVFDLENSLPPVNIMFLYKIIEWTGELADRAREIGDRLQILLAK
ncbi:MAG TPA: TIGR00153 family protein [Gammaproteobacteria bacterium]|nr:TIGR00153 family protein [Gammaproteobacteria bacterium]